MNSNQIRVGDHVKVMMSGNNLFGRIKEDRGPIGVGGRRLYGIIIDMAIDEEPLYVEMPADRFEIIKPKKEKT